MSTLCIFRDNISHVSLSDSRTRLSRGCFAGVRGSRSKPKKLDKYVQKDYSSAKSRSSWKSRRTPTASSTTDKTTTRNAMRWTRGQGVHTSDVSPSVSVVSCANRSHNGRTVVTRPPRAAVAADVTSGDRRPCIHVAATVIHTTRWKPARWNPRRGMRQEIVA